MYKINNIIDNKIYTRYKRDKYSIVYDEDI